MLNWPEKDPDEVLDYVIDWSARLAGDTITGSTWIVPVEGITKDSDTNSPTTTTIWLSGGSVGQAYTFTNRVTTLGGRTMDQSARIKIKEK